MADKIKIIYKNKYKERIRIFGTGFVQTNKYNCKIIIKGKEEELDEFYCGELKEKELEITLINIKNIIDMRAIFSGCDSLISLPDISEWDTSNVRYMSFMFKKCESLTFLPNISKWNTSKVIDMNSMFYGCKSLTNYIN